MQVACLRSDISSAAWLTQQTKFLKSDEKVSLQIKIRKNFE